MVWCGSKNGCVRDMCLRRHWIARSEHNNQSELNSRHNYRHHFMSTIIFTLIMDKIIKRALKNYEESGSCIDLDLLPSCTYHVFHIP